MMMSPKRTYKSNKILDGSAGLSLNTDALSPEKLRNDEQSN